MIPATRVPHRGHMVDIDAETDRETPSAYPLLESGPRDLDRQGGQFRRQGASAGAGVQRRQRYQRHADVGPPRTGRRYRPPRPLAAAASIAACIRAAESGG
jgi:hypothetical protein